MNTHVRVSPRNCFASAPLLCSTPYLLRLYPSKVGFCVHENGQNILVDICAGWVLCLCICLSGSFVQLGWNTRRYSGLRLCECFQFGSLR